MKKTIMLSLAVLSLVSLTAKAQEVAKEEKAVCDTVNSCKEHIKKAEMQLAKLTKNLAPNLSDIAKDEEGNVLHLNQLDAEKYCKEQGMRLPTIRELALYAQSLEAAGISETKKEELYLVKGSDAAGNSDHFYFSHKGYKRPKGDLGKYWFWSSSVHPDYTFSAYVLNGNNGDVGLDVSSYINDFNAVRCVR